MAKQGASSAINGGAEAVPLPSRAPAPMRIGPSPFPRVERPFADKLNALLDRVLAQYAEVLNASGGPDSKPARDFYQEHADCHPEFLALAQMANFVWAGLNR